MKRTLAVTLLSLVACTAIVFVADYGILRYRVASNRNPYGSVTTYVYYSVGEKNQRTEYVFNNSEKDTCVHSLFPHFGYAPCWYLARHTEKRIPI
jgi:hypothetical protein